MLESFKEYQSKPITRLAYRIKPEDDIQRIDDSLFSIRIGENGLLFRAYETIFPGDYIVHLSDEDVYHCRQAVFHERNIVD